MSTGEPTVVSVTIAGEEYKLRAQATPEYTRQCAEYLDQIIRDIREQTGPLEAQRLAILAGLALADQLFQAQRERDSVQFTTVETLRQLRTEIEGVLGASDLAASS